MKIAPELNSFFQTYNKHTELTEADLIQYVTYGLKLPVNNYDLYKTALTHSSFSNQTSDSKNNERLEFLGDAVIELYVSEYLIQNFPAWNEGELTQARKCIVCRKTLNAIAHQHLGLDRVLRHNLKGNLYEHNTLGDALEALVGAFFLDHPQKPDLIRMFVLQHIISPALSLLVKEKNSIFQPNAQPNAQPNEQSIPQSSAKSQSQSQSIAKKQPIPESSAKSQLNHFCQKHKLNTPIYKLTQPSNGQTLCVVTATIKAKQNKTEKVVKCQGKNKKEAENQAAKEILKYFQMGQNCIKVFA